MSVPSSTAHVTVEPETFTLVSYDSSVIATIVSQLAQRLDITHPIRVEVDETTPLGKSSAEFDGEISSDTTIVVRIESGALENTKRLTTFSEPRARLSLGMALLRARDRTRPDFDGVPGDRELTNAQNSAWDAYCAGRLSRLGLEPTPQRYRYDFRNRFGFSDDVDVAFDRLWAADDLGWSEFPTA